MKPIIQNTLIHQFSIFHKIATFLSLAVMVVLAGCGGGSSSDPQPNPVAATAVQVNLGDAPSDSMLAFSTTITGMSFTDSKGVVSTSTMNTPVELIHRTGTMEPFQLVTLSQGTYVSAKVTFAACNFTYVDPNTKILQHRTLTGPFTATVPFGSNVQLSTTPLVFNFDLDLEHSLTQDGSGQFQFSPQFHFSMGSPNSRNGLNARYGGMYQYMGIVNQVGADSFKMYAIQAAHTFTFRVNAQTQYQGMISQMSQLSNGMGVHVTATIQPDGTFLATLVRARTNAGGIMGGGIVTEVTGTPATELTIVMQNGAGASMLPDYLSQIVKVTLTPDTIYEIDDDRVNLSTLPFTPVFDASNIFLGQSVLPVSDTGIVVNGTDGEPIGTITASTLRLQERGIRGTTDVVVSPGTSSSFTLTLFPDCAFTSLTGATEILVIQQPTTNVEDDNSIPAGTTLRVHGLLFNNAGQWTIVASTIAAS